MTDQMTPAAMREAAERLRWDAENYMDDEQAQDAVAGAGALDRLADVLDIADDVTEHWRGLNDTHSESCWRWHAGCLARVLLDMEEQ